MVITSSWEDLPSLSCSLLYLVQWSTCYWFAKMWVFLQRWNVTLYIGRQGQKRLKTTYHQIYSFCTLPLSYTASWNKVNRNEFLDCNLVFFFFFSPGSKANPNKQHSHKPFYMCNLFALWFKQYWNVKPLSAKSEL